MNIDLNAEKMHQVVYKAINNAIRESIHELFHPEDPNEQIDMARCIHAAIKQGIDIAMNSGTYTCDAIEMGMKRGVEESMRDTPPIEDLITEHLEEARDEG